MSEHDIVVISGARTPFGRFGGSLKDEDVYELGAITMREVVKRADVAPEQVQDLHCCSAQLAAGGTLTGDELLLFGQGLCVWHVGNYLRHAGTEVGGIQAVYRRGGAEL